MTEKQKKIVKLHVEQGMTFSQLAERFCTSRNVIAGIVNRHKKKYIDTRANVS